jgi:VWFA-related protein
MRPPIGRPIGQAFLPLAGTSRGFGLLALSGFVGLVPVSRAQCQQVFPTDVTLVAVDATVLDREGRPVSALRREDFEIEVGGRPRRVVSAEFLRHAPPLGTAEPQALAPPIRNFASNQQGLIGRLIVLVPDVGNLTPGGARGAIEAARRFLDRLGPDDRVALVPIPVGPSVDFTADHSKVREALVKVMGSDRSRGMRLVSLAEAFAFKNQGRGDSRLWSEAVSRECAFARRQQEFLACRSQCEGEAADIYQTARAATAQSVAALRGLLRTLAAIPAPKTVVLLGQKLVTGSSMGEMGADRALADVGEAAAEARVTLYTLHIDRTFLELFDVRDYMPSHTPIEDARLHTDGLVAVAGHTGGQLFKVVASADAAFDRIALETSASWLLSFEPQEQDSDGRPHAIKVRVGNDRLQVRARPRFVVAAAVLQPAAADLARREIESPLPARTLPVSVAAFTLTRSGGSGVSLLLAAEVGGATGTDSLAVAYRMVDAKGTVLSGVVDAPSLRRIETPAGERLYYTTTLAVTPGRYRLRFAAADTRGRAGGVELLVDAQLRTSGSLGFSDLLVAEAGAPGHTASLSLSGSVPVGSVRAYVEMVGPADAVVSQVLFDLRPGGDAPPRLAALANLTPQDDAGRYRAEAVMDLQSLPAGDYVLRALTSHGETALGQIERPLTLVWPPAPAKPAVAGVTP